jgi:hypothetical protein
MKKVKHRDDLPIFDTAFYSVYTTLQKSTNNSLVEGGYLVATLVHGLSAKQDHWIYCSDFQQVSSSDKRKGYYISMQHSHMIQHHRQTHDSPPAT